MNSLGSIAALQARIATIEARVLVLGPRAGTTPLPIGSSGPAVAGKDFEPFGDVYQLALSQAGIIPDQATAEAAGISVDSQTGVVTGGGPAPVGTGSISAVGGFSDAGSGVNVAAAQRYAQSVGTAATSTGGITGADAATTGPVYTGAASMGFGPYANGASGSGQLGVGISGIAFTGAPYAGVSATPGSSVGKIGGFGAMPVPAELQEHGNGQLPDAALQSIGQNGHRLWGPAAASWRNAVAAANAEGIDLKITDSYRTYDQQVELAGRKGLYADGGLAAVPGTSNHGWGMAVDADITNPATLNWIRANGYKFGFVEAVTREPWHWEFRPQQA